MRLYVYEQGTNGLRGFVRAEYVLAEHHWQEGLERGMERGYMHPPCSFDGEILTREEMLAVSTRRRALLAWESGDDSNADKSDLAYSFETDVYSLRELGEWGCRQAGIVLSGSAEPLERRRFVREHKCSVAACGRREGQKTHLESV